MPKVCVFMLKKASHIIMSLLLVTTTLGITLNAHYCGNHLKSVSVLADQDSCCNIPDGCCHDESETFRIEDEFASSSIHFEPKLVLIQVLDYFIPSIEDLTATHFRIRVIEEPPPPTTRRVLSNLQVYIL
jgi:hypothetical protein